MATAHKFSIRDTLKVVDVSKEIVLDVMFLTTDLLHSIRNNLPIDMSTAQVTLQGARMTAAPETVIAEIMPVSRRRRAWAALVVVAVFGAAAVVGALFTFDEMRAEKIDGALNQAHTLVASASSFEIDTVDIRLEVARDLVVQGHPSRAATLLEPLVDSRRRDEVIEVLAPAWLASGRLEDVRSLVSKAGVTTKRPAILTDAFNQSWELDPRFSTTPRPITPQNIIPITEGVFGVQLGDTHGTLEVPTEERPDDWQDSIAARRLCMVLGCRFAVPQAELVSLEMNGVQTVGAWIPASTDGAAFPIEHVRGWRHLLRGESDETSATTALRAWKRLPQYKDVAAELETASAQDLAAQMSSLIVFDFLANNHGRFASSRTDWGEHVRVADGQLHTTVQSRIFNTRSSKRVRGRFLWSEKLPASEVAAALAIDVARLGVQIFPVETPDRSDKLYALARQQEALARRSRQLEKEVGFSSAFPF
jgi:hypothetical protein